MCKCVAEHCAFAVLCTEFILRLGHLLVHLSSVAYYVLNPTVVTLETQCAGVDCRCSGHMHTISAVVCYSDLSLLVP